MTTRPRTSLRLFASAAVLAVSGVALVGGTASADPVGAPSPRPLVGVGSDTTDPVMNGLADAITVNGAKVLGSYDALGGDFNPRGSASAACSYTGNLSGTANGAGIRANGSGAGRSRLLESLTPGDPKSGCLDFSRSSSLNRAAAPVNLTYVPFALDGVSYAVRGDSTIPRDLSQATLKAIYACAPETRSAYEPLIPQAGSGTRSFWLSFVGLTEATIPSCVKDTYLDPADAKEKSVQEHSGRGLVSKKNIVPFSSAQWSAQSVGTIADVRFGAVLGGIDGIPAISVNAGAVNTRKVYNVLPTGRLSGAGQNDLLLQQVFKGTTSEICKQSAVIGRFGLSPIADCGATTLTTQ